MLISVCLCTYKRQSLIGTLESIAGQELPPGYSLEIVVVDNDVEESGRAVCEKVLHSQTGSPESKVSHANLQVRYFVNGTRNLSEVRNTTMEKANGSLLAFIDDDEWASDRHWLKRMLDTMEQCQADAVFGKVVVHYPDSAPEWIVAGDLFGKDTHAHRSTQKKGATSNALLKAEWVKEKNFRFDPVFGKSGGEDTDFFHRIYKAGGTLIYDAHAVVEETVEPHRLSLDYIKKQNIRIGQTHYSYLWSKQSGLAWFKTGLFVLAQIAGYGLMSLVSLPFGKEHYLRWYVLFVRNVVKLKTAVLGTGSTVELYGNS